MANTQTFIEEILDGLHAPLKKGGRNLILSDYELSVAITKALEGKVIVDAEELRHVLEFTTPFCSQEIKQHLLSTIEDES